VNRFQGLTVLFHKFDVSDLEHSEAREVVRRCDLVVGIDGSRTENNKVCVYGRGLLKDIANGRAAEWGPDVRVAEIRYDQRTGNLEKLCAHVWLLRGKCDYGKQIEL
jgi:hypothetical protein